MAAAATASTPSAASPPAPAPQLNQLSLPQASNLELQLSQRSLPQADYLALLHINRLHQVVADYSALHSLHKVYVCLALQLLVVELL